MAAGAPVLLGLRDAAMAGPCRGGAQAPAWATNKLGGSADWVPSVRPGWPRCGLCGAALAHLLQVYCPLEGSPSHRVANVFACAGQGCWGAPRSWKVLRSHYLQTEEEERRNCSIKQPTCGAVSAGACTQTGWQWAWQQPGSANVMHKGPPTAREFLFSEKFGAITAAAQSMVKQASNFAAKDWCDEADDWGVCDGAQSPASASLQLLGLNEVVSSSLSRELECASQFQQLCLSGATDGPHSLSTPPADSQAAVMAAQSSAPLFQPFYISVVDEEDYTGLLDTDHADKLLKEYQQREGVDLEQLVSESFAGEGDGEKYEKSEVKGRDHTFHKFMKRVSVCPEQILRYSRGGQPLFITCPPANIDRGIPACSSCGGSRVFEFQLMPALVSMLQSDSDLSVEFGTVLVYTCERSCWPANCHTPLEEFVFVQEDPDQRLFK